MTMNDLSKPKVKVESVVGDHKSVVQELNGLTVVVVAPLDFQIAFLVR
jgi:hypothetical protein